VLYMPLLFFAIFATVQFGLMFLGNQAASAAAREAARVARVGGSANDAQLRGQQYLATVGKGIAEPLLVEVTFLGPVGDQEVRAVVRARGLQVVPGLPAPVLEQVVQGPVEGFRVDNGA
jgi:Flp pilus assembly protein TadG